MSLMGEVYRRAQCVLACVGDHADNSQDLYCILRENLDSLCRYRSKILRLHSEIKLQFPSTWNWSHPMDKALRLLNAFRAFLTRPYFQRLWIYQELYLAKKVEVCCGYDHISIDSLHLLALGHPSWVWKIDESDEPLRVPPAKYLLREGAASGARKSSLLTLLTHVQELGLQCRDIRDKCFGILGMVDWERYTPIMPDYKKDAFEVAEELFKTIAESGELRNHTWNERSDADESSGDEFEQLVPTDWTELDNSIALASQIGEVFEPPPCDLSQPTTPALHTDELKQTAPKEWTELDNWIELASQIGEVLELFRWDSSPTTPASHTVGLARAIKQRREQISASVGRERDRSQNRKTGRVYGFRLQKGDAGWYLEGNETIRNIRVSDCDLDALVKSTDGSQVILPRGAEAGDWCTFVGWRPYYQNLLLVVRETSLAGNVFELVGLGVWRCPISWSTSAFKVHLDSEDFIFLLCAAITFLHFCTYQSLRQGNLQWNAICARVFEFLNTGVCGKRGFSFAEKAHAYTVWD